MAPPGPVLQPQPQPSQKHLHNNLAPLDKSALYSNTMNKHKYSTIQSKIMTGMNKQHKNSRGSKIKHKNVYNDTIRVINTLGHDVTPRPLYNNQYTIQSNNNIYNSHTTQHGITTITHMTDNSGTNTSVQQPTTGTMLMSHNSHVQANTNNIFNSTVVDYDNMNNNKPPTQNHNTDINNTPGNTTDIMNGGLTDTYTNNATHITNVDYDMKERLFQQSILAMTNQSIHTVQPLTEYELKQAIDIHIGESELYILYSQPQSKYNSLHSNYNTIVSHNQHYNESIDYRQRTSDAYTDNITQTVHHSKRDKEIQCIQQPTSDVCVGVSTYELYDTYNIQPNQNEQTNNDKLPVDMNNNKVVSVQSDVVQQPNGLNSVHDGTAVHGTNSSHHSTTAATQSQFNHSSHNTGYRSIAGDSTLNQSTTQQHSTSQSSVHSHSTEQSTHSVYVQPVSKYTRITQSDSFLNAVKIMEQCIQSSVFYDELLIYRDYNHVHDNDRYDTTNTKLSGKPNKLSLDPLIQFQCKLTDHYNITCMTQNYTNTDLIAIGYSRKQFVQHDSVDGWPDTTTNDNTNTHNGKCNGLVVFWSIKNTVWPHSYYRIDSPVTSIQFNPQYTYLLGVGLYSGNIHIYDTRHQSVSGPLYSSNYTIGKHYDPIWNISWLYHLNDGSVSLVSAGSDGLVLQWNMKKGLQYNILIQLKAMKQLINSVNLSAVHSTAKHTNHILVQQSTSNLSSHNGSALCLDVHPNDTQTYLVGTEDGYIHRCSTSYNEQILDNYVGHTGAVYCVQYNKYCTDIFITSSNDWSVQIWHTQQPTQSILKFTNRQSAYVSVQWCGNNSATFITCTYNGTIELYDLTQSTVDPILSYDTGHTLNLVQFAVDNNNIIYACTNTGITLLYHLCGISLKKLQSDTEQINQLSHIITNNNIPSTNHSIVHVHSAPTTTDTSNGITLIPVQ